MPRIILLAAVAVAAAVTVPSVADGATLHQNGSLKRVLLQDEVGETNLITVEGARGVVIHDANAPIEIDRVPVCMRVDAYTVSCSRAVRVVELDLGIGPDVATVNTPREVQVDGGPGNDRYNALATGPVSQVTFEGGVGLDTANYFYATAGVHVSLEEPGNDGRAGDDDRIFRDVEAIIGSRFADVLVGSPFTLQLMGQDGDDQITGGTGPETLSGGDGNDAIAARDGAADSIDCGGQLLDRAVVDIGAEASITRCAEVSS